MLEARHDEDDDVKNAEKAVDHESDGDTNSRWSISKVIQR